MITSIDPATGKIVYQTQESNVDDAIKKAVLAYPAWKKRSFEERAGYCKRYAEILLKQKDNLALTISSEMGKPLWEAHTEVQAMINKVAISIKAYYERCQERIVPGQATRFHPHGVVAVFGPFNFPGHLPNGHIVPALLAGNTVIFKPSEKTPKVGLLMSQMWQEAGLPDGVFVLVQGAKEIAQKILEHKEIAGLFFTGSTHVGRYIQEQSLDFPGRILALEMGGNNPLVVTRVADVKACVYTIIQSAFLTSGQRCSAARRLIVTDDSILAPLVDAASKIKVGAYTDTPEPFMGPVVSKAAADSLEEGYKALKGTPLLAFKRHENFIHPTIIDMTGCPMDDTELFGPILQVVRVKNLEEAIIEANNTSFGLVAGLISDSATDYAQFYEGVKAGVVNWNTPTTGASSSAPFGGIGCSGNYRPSAYFAADYVSYPVASQEVPAVQLPQKIVPGVEL